MLMSMGMPEEQARRYWRCQCASPAPPQDAAQAENMRRQL